MFRVGTFAVTLCVAASSVTAYAYAMALWSFGSNSSEQDGALPGRDER
jgi:hypothetical protein